MQMPHRREEVDALVFDSGLGGLSVAGAIRRLMPGIRLAYVADDAGLPYGDKSEAWLISRVQEVIEAMLLRVDPQVIVIACNTASTVVLPPLRARCSQAIVGVVPAIKPAAGLSRSRVIGLLATPATIQRSYTDSLIQQFAADCEVLRVGSSELVMMAERKMRGEDFDRMRLGEVCKPLLADPRLDTLVLGCTHFPLLADELQALLPGARILDSGDAIALRVRQLLPSEPSGPSAGGDQAYFSAPLGGPALAKALLEFGFARLSALPLGPV